MLISLESSFQQHAKNQSGISMGFQDIFLVTKKLTKTCENDLFKNIDQVAKILLRKYQQNCIIRHTCSIKCKYLENPYFDFWHADSPLCEEQKY